MKDAIGHIRKIIKEEVAQANTGLDHAQLEELIDDRVKGYLETIGDRVPHENANERTVGNVPIEKVNDRQFQVELLRTKAITQMDSVPGHGEVGLTPWFKLGKGNPLAELVDISEDLEGAGAFKVVQVSGADFEQRDDTSDTLTEQGTLTSETVPLNEFNLKIVGTKSAVEDVVGLPQSVFNYTMDRWNSLVGQKIVDNMLANTGSTINSGVSATASVNGSPTKQNVISKLTELCSSISTEYLRGATLVLNPDIYATLLDALATTSTGGFRYDPMSDMLYFPGGYAIIPSSHIATAKKQTDALALFGNLQNSTLLGLRRTLVMDQVNSSEDPAKINWLCRTRFAVAKKDVTSISKMVAKA